MNEPTDADRRTAEELLSREYGKDHPAARHNFTLTFVTTTHAHRVSELARALAAERARARAEALEEAAKLAAAESDAWRTIPPHEMALHCPACGKQHLDIGEFATRVHRKHLCENTTDGPGTGCGHLWVPFHYATKGVQVDGASLRDQLRRLYWLAWDVRTKTRSEQDWEHVGARLDEILDEIKPEGLR